MIKILYIRDRNGRNYGTVAYNIADKQYGKVTFAAASCNSNDAFNKHIGIDMATSRLANAPTEVVFKPDATNADIVRAILTKISRSENLVSVSARKLCKKMLRRYLQDSYCGGCCC